MSDLPEITEIKRIRYRPGDRFLLKCSFELVSREQAQEILRQIRTALQLPDDVPMAIITDDIEVEVVAPAGEDELDFIPASADELE